MRVCLVHTGLGGLDEEASNCKTKEWYYAIMIVLGHALPV